MTSLLFLVLLLQARRVRLLINHPCPVLLYLSLTVPHEERQTDRDTPQQLPLVLKFLPVGCPLRNWSASPLS